MTKFDQYFSDEKIIYAICKIRAKYAKKKNDKQLLHQLSTDPTLNHHLDKLNEDEKKLREILPSRRKWKKLKIGKRYNNKSQKINSIDSNISSLIITIDWYRKNCPSEPFLLNLDHFINELKNSINNPNYIIETPNIYPKLKGSKNKTENVCRPISLYNLKDRIIVGVVNKYFTNLFDDFFYENALAFRAIKDEGGRNIVPSHHDAVRKIITYKRERNRKHLWVSESDMNKFFDSVSHSIIKAYFKKLLIKVQRKHSESADIRAIGLFNKYLNSYNFIKDVLPKNKNKEYWEDLKIPGGKYGWVKDSLLSLGYYKNLSNAKIGIAQGGALSGLIANIVLDYADQKIIKQSDKQLGYFRFCDDMIIIHPNRNKCQEFVNIYVKALGKLKLVPHPFEKDVKNTPESFWNKDIKSKGPYKWSSDFINSIPWIGFVGYEINYDEYIRVRKNSLKKELDKQKETIKELRAFVLNKRRPNIKNGTIIESAIKKLIGMSIGRESLWNINTGNNVMCWVNGFSELNNNKYVRRQLKMLDWGRNKQIYKLKKDVERFDDSIIQNKRKGRSREIIFYGKPFSYYYHVITKPKPEVIFIQHIKTN